MSETVLLVAAIALHLTLFGALGSGPTLALARGLPGRAVLAPIVGLAIWAAASTTAGWFVPMRVAAWAVVLPLTVASLAWAVALLARRRERRPGRETGISAAIVAGAALVAGLPGLVAGTLGPVSLGSGDAWGYINPSTWLQGHTFRDDLPPEAIRFDLVDYGGWAFTILGDRPGLLTGNAATSALVGTTPDRTHYALLIVLCALVPAGIWIVLRTLGAGRAPSAVGALLGLSPLVLVGVADSRTANLAGMAIAPVALLVAGRAIGRGAWRDAVLAAILVAGLVSAFVEFMVPLVAALAVGGVIVALARRREGRLTREWAGHVSLRTLAIAALAAAMAPVSVERAITWLDWVAAASDLLAGWPALSLSPANAPAWAAGVLHVYELPESDALPAAALAATVAVPLVLLAAVVLGATRSRITAAVVFGPLAAALVSAIAAYERNGGCQYCGMKGFTFAAPFLGVGVGLAVAALLALPRRAGTLAAAGVALLAVGPVVRSDAALVQEWTRSSAAVAAGSHDVTEALEDLGPALLLLEGTDATAVGGWTWLELYYLASRAPEALISFQTAGVALPLPGEQYWTPAYRYVLTTFGGVESGRRRIADLGDYSLFERAPLDVAIVGTAWSVDTAAPPRGVPWVTTPFQLRVTGAPEDAVALSVRYARPLRDEAQLAFTLLDRPLPVARAGGRAGERTVCVELPHRDPSTTVLAIPLPDAVAPTAHRPVGAWVEGSPPRSIGILEVQARPGRC